MAYYERRLPHWHPQGRDIFITWRLDGSLPNSRFIPPAGLTTGEAFACIDRLLDKATFGPSWLRRPEVARSVVDGLRYAAKHLRHYDLHADVVMSNHVHMLITPHQPVPKIMQSLKGYTARQANLLLRQTGVRFWKREFYDHWVREGEFDRIKRYIELNPVRAGPVSKPHLYPWSSAAPCEGGLEAVSPA
jgi:putative transposase